MTSWHPNRRHLILTAGAAVMAQSTGAAASLDLHGGFSPPDASDAELASAITAKLDAAIADKRIWNLRGLVILRGGRLIVERYFEGHDRARGVGDLGLVSFKPDTLHDLRSCSKSIVALLYGIALARGLVPPPEAPLLAAFREYADLAGRDGRDRLAIAHALTMTMGIDWDESSFDYADPRNSETAMDAAPDRYGYVLERKVVEAPGAHWTYCGGATALLARLIARGSGQPLHEFARQNLFDLLGLGPTQWATGADGEPFAASGARMSVRDLARIGQLMLDGGRAGDRAIVSGDWLKRCTTPHVSADELRRYGYQWFLLDVAFGKPKGWAPGRLERMWLAMGEGGQRLFVIPGLHLVIALTAGNYGHADQWMPPTRVLRDVVLASIA
jgi:CubicO group peptidase (beta-lactamase class C family)